MKLKGLDINKKIYKNSFSDCTNSEEFEGEERNKCVNSNFYNIEKGIDFYFCFENCEYDCNKCYMKDQKYFPISNPNSDTNLLI